MNNEIIRAYLNEFSNPDFPAPNHAGCIDPVAMKAYFTWLNSLRIAFLQEIATTPEAMQRFYLEEIVKAKNVVLGRKSLSIQQQSVDDMLGTELHQIGLALNYARMQDEGLMKSLNDAEETIKKFLPDLVEISDNNSPANTIETPEAPKKEYKAWMTLNEVCDYFHLSINNVKDRKWREKNNFPAGNSEAYGKLIFSAKEVEEWLKHRGKC